MADFVVGPGGGEYATIQAAWNATTGGDRIRIRTGTYSGAGNSGWSPASKLNNTIEAYGDGAVVIDGGGTDIYILNPAITANGLIIRNLKLYHPSNQCIVVAAGFDGLTVEDTTFQLHTNGNSGITTTAGGGTTNNIVIRRCHFYQWQDTTAPSANTFGIYYLGGAAAGITVEDCVFESLVYGILMINACAGVSRRNTFRALTVARSNTGYRHGGNATYTFQVENCTFQHLNHGMQNATTNNAVTIRHCVFEDNNYGAYIYFYAAAVDNCIFTHGIVGIQGDSGGDQPAPRNCCFHGNSSSDITGYTACTNPVNADPLYVGVPDFNLQTTSPCIDAGVAAGATDDFTGKRRPLEKGPDIGAYEIGNAVKIDGVTYPYKAVGIQIKILKKAVGV